YTVRCLAQDEHQRWDSFVSASPEGTVFHSTAWLEAAGMPFELYGCFNGTELLGGWAVSRGGKCYAGGPITSLPPYLGVIFSPPAPKYVTTLSNNKAVAATFAVFLKDTFERVELRLPPEIVDVQPFIWEGYRVQVRYTYRLRLEDLSTAVSN